MEMGWSRPLDGLRRGGGGGGGGGGGADGLVGLPVAFLARGGAVGDGLAPAAFQEVGHGVFAFVADCAGGAGRLGCVGEGRLCEGGGEVLFGVFGLLSFLGL